MSDAEASALVEDSALTHPEVEDILRVVEPVASRFSNAGFSLYLVGGVVRDLALGGHGDMNDIDLTTDARPDEIKRLLGEVAKTLWTQGERFGTIGSIVNGRALEITTHRAESYDPDSRKPMVVFGDDLRTDLSRRDFSINAMAYSVTDRVLHDPFGGMPDLAAGLLRTPEDPVVSFVDDPLRMLRAARFIPRFGLLVDPQLETAVTQLGERLDIVSRERVHDELERLLAVADPWLGFDFLRRTGLLAHIVPAFASAEVESNTGRAGSTGKNLIDNGCFAASQAGSTAVRRAGLLAGLEPDTARQWLSDLRYSTADCRQTVGLLDGMKLLLASDPTAAVVRRLVKVSGQDQIREVFQLARNIASQGQVDLALVEVAEGVLHGLESSEDLSGLSSPVSGGDLISTLGLAPGPLVGQTLAMLGEHRLDHGPFDTQVAYDLAREWLLTQDH